MPRKASVESLEHPISRSEIPDYGFEIFYRVVEKRSVSFRAHPVKPNPREHQRLINAFVAFGYDLNPCVTLFVPDGDPIAIHIN